MRLTDFGCESEDSLSSLALAGVEVLADVLPVFATAQCRGPGGWKCLKQSVIAFFLEGGCVHGGRKRIPLEIAVEIAEHHTDDALTDREIEVLRLVASGNANKIIAGTLAFLKRRSKLTCGRFSQNLAPTIAPTLWLSR